MTKSVLFCDQQILTKSSELLVIFVIIINVDRIGHKMRFLYLFSFRVVKKASNMLFLTNKFSPDHSFNISQFFLCGQFDLNLILTKNSGHYLAKFWSTFFWPYLDQFLANILSSFDKLLIVFWSTFDQNSIKF